MILFEEAKNIIKKNISKLEVEIINFDKSLNYVLAENIIAKENHPSFNNSAVDGFAVFQSEVVGASKTNPVKLKIDGVIKAGDEIEIKIKNFSAVKIMTGAKIPFNCTSVVMVENCDIDGKDVKVLKAPKLNENIRLVGDEIKIGETILKKGIEITPAALALMSTLGCKKIKVYKKPKISILTTGSELVDVTKKLPNGKIRNSNKYFLQSVLKNNFFDVVFELHNIKDEEKRITEAIKKSILKSDVTIITGGVSVGDYDLVRDVLKKIKVKELFWGIAIKPGKPTFVGKINNKFVIGLPGNPVAVGVIFYEIILPFLNLLKGKEKNIIEADAIIKKSIQKKTRRLEFLRGITEKINNKIFVTPVKGQQSHMMSGLVEADCLISFPLEKEILNENDEVKIHFIPN